MKKNLILALICVTLSVCGLISQNTTLDANIESDIVEYQDNKRDSLVSEILDEAKSHIGKKYVWATRGPKTFDCSGFVYYVFRQFDITLTPSSRNQYKHGKAITKNEAKAGDLIFFRSKRSGKNVGHVGIICDTTDNIKFIHASTKQGITISNLEGYYIKNFIGIKRVV